MGEALIELEQILRSKQEDYLTSREANVLMTCQANAIKEFTIGFAGGGGVTWLATLTLSKLLRINLSAGIATICGYRRFDRSLDSSIEHILSLDGSMMQKELATIVLKRFRDDPRTLQLMSKRFYPENVFDDSSTDQLKLRWRFRNFYSDNATHSQGTHESDSYSGKTDSERTDRENPDEPKLVSSNPWADAITNPFDCVFGLPGSSEEIHHTSTSSTSPKRHSRSLKRSHRRHRMRHHEVSSNIQFA